MVFDEYVDFNVVFGFGLFIFVLLFLIDVDVVFKFSFVVVFCFFGFLFFLLLEGLSKKLKVGINCFVVLLYDCDFWFIVVI